MGSLKGVKGLSFVAETPVYFVLILVGVGLALYSSALAGPFVLDDLLYIVYNPGIKGFSGFTDLSPTRYVAYLSFALNYAAGALDPLGYRVFNLAVHVLNAVLVYNLVNSVYEAVRTGPATRGAAGAGTRVAAASAIIFLVHPVQIQAVTYISQRFTSLAALFYLASLYCYVKARLKMVSGSRAWPVYLLSLALAVAAQKTKEISFTLPFMILLFEFSFFDNRARMKALALRMAPFFLTLVIIPASLFLAASGGGGVGGAAVVDRMMRSMKIEELSSLSTIHYLLTEARVVVTYLRLLVYPAGLHFDYDYPLSTSIAEPWVIISALLLLSIFGAAVYMLARRSRGGSPTARLVPVGIIWFFLALSIESSFIPIKDVIFEHRLYLPSVGLIVSFSAALFYAAEHLGPSKKTVRVALYALFWSAVCLLSVATYQRNKVWSDDLRLYRDEVAKNSREAPPRNYLGMAYKARGMLEEAGEQFRSATELDPLFGPARKNLGLTLLELGDYDGALDEFRALKRLVPGYAGAYYNAGLAYLGMGMKTRAAEEFREVLKLNPGDGEARRMLSGFDDPNPR